LDIFKLNRLIIVALLAVIAFFALVVGDWYRFVKYAELDAKRGVYGNDHLEVWIDINLMMPAPVRAWGCKTLLAREEKVLGFRPGRAPLGCNPELENLPALDVYMLSFTANAELELDRNNATPAQKESVTACLKAEVLAALTTEQQEALKSGTDTEAVMAVTDLGRKATVDCLARAGF
jgi:hypothetical protein